MPLVDANNIFAHHRSTSSIVRQADGAASNSLFPPLNAEVNQRVVDCPDGSGSGYDTIQDIIDDQQAEFDRIKSGQGAPRPPYVFPICPSTQFDMEEQSLEVLLDGATFTCGNKGASSDKCVFFRGWEQVRIDNSEIDGYKIQQVQFTGLTFTGFTITSVNALAKAGTTAVFEDCIWRDFSADFVVNLGVEWAEPVLGMTVEIRGESVIQGGECGTCFMNSAGTLTFDDIQFTRINANDAIKTSAGGASILNQVLFNDGELEYFAIATDGSTQKVTNTTVSGLTAIIDIFHVRGEGTSMLMSSTQMRDNKSKGTSPFTGVRAWETAKAIVKRSTFVGNSGVSFGFQSKSSSTLELVDVDIINNTGVDGALTSGTYADDNTKLTLQHVTFEDNSIFMAHVFALFNSSVDISSSCFNSGGSDLLLFFSEDSSYTDVDNFVSPGMTSITCKNPGDGRLAQETQDSGCYDPADKVNPCSITCAAFGNSSQCLATMAPTTTPSAPPSLSPGLLDQPVVNQGAPGMSVPVPPPLPLNPRVNKRTIACSNSNPPLVGYDRIQDLINDQQEEFQRIESGEDPEPPYYFPICPNNLFDMSATTLSVLLDGSMFTCGNHASRSESCGFFGGSEQIRIEDSTLEDYVNHTTKFVGLTFTGFSNSSVHALANAGTSATFEDCIWRDFKTNSVISLGTGAGENATTGKMQVDISQGSLMQNGECATCISNDGGALTLNDVQFKSIKATNVLTTSNGGTTILDQVFFQEGEVEYFSLTSHAATHTVAQTTISGLGAVVDIFNVRGEGTSMTMVNTHMRDNLIEGASAFSGVQVVDGAKATVMSSSFSGNTAVSYGFQSRFRGSLELIDVSLKGNAGIAGALTACTYSERDAALTLHHVTFEDNLVFTAQVFALFNTSVEVSSSCFNSGGGDTILFISEDSSYSDVDNFVSGDMTSNSCGNLGDGRLAQENQGSGCFDPTDGAPCSIECKPFGTANICLATEAPTTIPSVQPSATPSLPPVYMAVDDGVCSFEQEEDLEKNPVKAFPSLELPCPSVGDKVFASMDFLLENGSYVVSVAASHGINETDGIAMDWGFQTLQDVERSFQNTLSTPLICSEFFEEQEPSARTANGGCGGKLATPSKLCDSTDYPTSLFGDTPSGSSMVKHTFAVWNTGGCEGKLLLEANIRSSSGPLDVICLSGLVQYTCEELPSLVNETSKEVVGNDTERDQDLGQDQDQDLHSAKLCIDRSGSVLECVEKYEECVECSEEFLVDGEQDDACVSSLCRSLEEGKKCCPACSEQIEQYQQCLIPLIRESCPDFTCEASGTSKIVATMTATAFTLVAGALFGF